MYGESIIKATGYGMGLTRGLGKQVLKLVSPPELPPEHQALKAQHETQIADMRKQLTSLVEMNTSDLSESDSQAVKAAIPEVMAALVFAKNLDLNNVIESFQIDPASAPDEADTQRLMGNISHAQDKVDNDDMKF